MKYLSNYVFTVPILIGMGLAAAGHPQGAILVQIVMWPLVIVGQLHWVVLFNDEERSKKKAEWEAIPVAFRTVSYATFVVTTVGLALLEMYFLLAFYFIMMLAVMLIRNSKN